jgi:hypothetical protein
MARFAREARLLATLNPPHIGAIYDTGSGRRFTCRFRILVDRMAKTAGL